MARSKKPKGQEVIRFDEKKQEGKLRRIGGSNSDDFNSVTVGQAINTVWPSQSDAENHEQQLQAVIASMLGAGPRDEIEGMLAAQMIGTHNAAMECFRRAILPDQTFEGRRENLNQATKLVRSYASLVECLNRHRGKGQQHVTVEHVHVNQGGQAIVGAVNSRRAVVANKEAGTKEEEQHRAAITHQPAQPMRCEDTEWEAVPITASSGKEAL